MGTVGLSFGNLASGTGFDVASTVSSILAISGAVETPWKTQLTALKAQDTVLSTLGTDLSTLSTSLSSLTSFDGVFYSKLGSSSDTSVLALSSASSSSTAGSHTIVVNSLASTSSDYSDRITNASDTLSGSLQIQIGSGAAQTITLGSTDTLSSLAATINSGSYGVTASVVTDTLGSRLSLVSQTSGAAGQIALTSNLTDSTNSNTAINFTQGQPGADANITVDGLATTSASNTVTTAIPGVTFQLLNVSPTSTDSNGNTTSTPVQIQITNDNSSIETAFQSLVTAYNAVVTDLTAQETNDSSGNAEPLFGSTTISTLQTQLSQAIFGGLPSGTGTSAISSITQLGLSVGTDGKLTLTNSSLDTALNNNFSNVLGFLQNTGSFGQNFTSVLSSLGTTSSTGVLYLAQQENTSQEANLNSNIANEETLLAAQKTTLTTELNAANQILQSLPSQLEEVDEVYSAETGYNTGSGS